MEKRVEACLVVLLLASLAAACSSRTETGKQSLGPGSGETLDTGGGPGTGGSSAGGGSDNAGGLIITPDSTPACPAIACVSGFTLDTPLPVLSDQVRGLQVQMCRNEVCSKGVVTDDQPVPGGDVGAGVSFPPSSPPAGSVDAYVAAREDGLRLRVHYTPWTDDDLKDGDFYEVTANRASGFEVVWVEKTVTYVRPQPNGEDCAFLCPYASYVTDAMTP